MESYWFLVAPESLMSHALTNHTGDPETQQSTCKKLLPLLSFCSTPESKSSSL